jgi:hypothetical protein
MAPPARHLGDDGNGWDEYKNMVLSQIQEMREAIGSARDEMQALRAEMSDEFKQIAVDIGKLNVKAGLWGALAGAVLTAEMILMQQLAR